MRPQLFIIATGLLANMDPEDIMATYADMQELGIAKLPYPDLDLRVSAHECVALRGDAMLTEASMRGDLYAVLKYRGGVLQDLVLRTPLRPAEEFSMKANNPKPIDTPGHRFHGMDWMTAISQLIGGAFVVLLATRGVERETTVDKLAKLGIGSGGKHRYAYTTTLTLGRNLEHHDSAKAGGHGVEKRPHLRRGHVRHQHHGPRNQLIRQVWIEPCFVNGYVEDHAPVRLNYNVSKAPA